MKGIFCQKCWDDAHLRMINRGGTQTQHYCQLLTERKLHPCNKEEQVGKK